MLDLVYMNQTLDMKKTTSIAEVPYQPAVYAIYFEDLSAISAAYVGSTIALREKLSLQLSDRRNILSLRHSRVERDAGLSLEVRWWEHPDFTETSALEAAELIAFVTLNSSFSMTGTISDEAKAHIVNELFREKMHQLFNSEPSGAIVMFNNDLEKLAN